MSRDRGTRTETILDYAVELSDLGSCVDEIAASLERGDSCRLLACFNPHSYVVSLSDHEFAQSLRNADWLLPDGIGIVLASRFLGGQIRKRVTGSDIFRAVNKRLDEARGSAFFLGATDETLNAIRAKMNNEYPNVRIAGTYSPPFKPVFSQDDVDAMVNAVNAARPDVLWVGMTSPKQDRWLYKNQHRLKAKFAAGVGAVFDFYSGHVKRPRPFFQRTGLEWLPRLVQEPRRLWRRNVVSTPIFIGHVLLYKLGHGLKQSTP